MCKAIDSLSLQAAVVGVSVEKIVFALKETSNEKGTLEQRVKGLQSKVKQAYKSHLVKQKWKFNLKIMTGDNISDGDAGSLYCTGLFSHDKHGEKWAQCVRCYRWAHEECGVEEDYFVCPMWRKSVKL